MSQLFASGGQSIGVWASASVIPVNIQDWFPLGWTGWISLQSKRLSRVFSNTTVWYRWFIQKVIPGNASKEVGKAWKDRERKSFVSGLLLWATEAQSHWRHPEKSRGPCPGIFPQDRKLDTHSIPFPSGWKKSMDILTFTPWIVPAFSRVNSRWWLEAMKSKDTCSLEQKVFCQ